MFVDRTQNITKTENTSVSRRASIVVPYVDTMNANHSQFLHHMRQGQTILDRDYWSNGLEILLSHLLHHGFGGHDQLLKVDQGLTQILHTHYGDHLVGIIVGNSHRVDHVFHHEGQCINDAMRSLNTKNGVEHIAYIFDGNITECPQDLRSFVERHHKISRSDHGQGLLVFRYNYETGYGSTGCQPTHCVGQTHILGHWTVGIRSAKIHRRQRCLGVKGVLHGGKMRGHLLGGEFTGGGKAVYTRLFPELLNQKGGNITERQKTLTNTRARVHNGYRIDIVGTHDCQSLRKRSGTLDSLER
mmetsp:Transcript_44700/g.112676  ORF Transcript_44700/g.112676 Transcript_44700/m.112676 type:complete len:301 (+) Transcript_44700:76-978(+)